MWPVANSPDLLILKQAIPASMVPKPSTDDEVLWVPSRLGKFSTNSAWQALRTHHSRVTWYKLLWYPLAIPKCSFILWLAIRGRLGTLDRLHLTPNIHTCFLCNNQGENHDHLFFKCPFSKFIWERLMQKCHLYLGDLSWEDCYSQMVLLCRGKSLTAVVRKLSLAVSVYQIWAERNSRLHENGFRREKEVLWSISDLIRLRLYLVTGIPDTAENRSIQIAWSLPDSIFG